MRCSRQVRPRTRAVVAAALSVFAVASCGVSAEQSAVIPRGLGDAAAASPGQAGPGVAANAAAQHLADRTPAPTPDVNTPVIPVPHAQNIAVASAAPMTGIVSNGTGKLAVVNLATRTITGSIEIPYENFSAGTLTAQPESPYVWVGNNQGNFVAIVNAQTREFVKVVALPAGPGGGAYVTNGFITMGKTDAYILNSFWSGWPGMPPTAITRVDLAAQAVVDQLVMPDNGLATPAAANGVLAPDGNSIYVAAWAKSGQGVFQMTLAVRDADVTKASPGSIWRQVAPLPYVDALAGSGSDLYATQDTENLVTRINMATNTVTGVIRFAAGNPAADTMASSLFVTPDGRQLWEGAYFAGQVSSVNLGSSAVRQLTVANISGNFADCESVASVCVPTSVGIALVRAE